MEIKIGNTDHLFGRVRELSEKGVSFGKGRDKQQDISQTVLPMSPVQLRPQVNVIRIL